MRCIVFFSGAGTTTEALLKQEATNDYQISLLVTDNPQAGGITNAQSYNKELLIVPKTTNNQQWCEELRAALDNHSFDMIVLAGFMRILSADFVQAFAGKIINIHPSLLPDFKGLHTHARALAAGVAMHGFSIHLVTQELDAGAILAQRSIAVADNDDAHSLQQRVQHDERFYYPQVLQLLATKRLFWSQSGIYMDNTIINAKGVQL